MSQSRITINLKCNKVADWAATIAFLKRLDPVFLVACIDNKNDDKRIFELHKELPNTKIIARFIIIVHNPDGSEVELDGGMHLAPKAIGDTRRYVVSPADFLNAWGYLGEGGLSLYTINEPQATDASDEDIRRLVQWSIEVIALATQRGISLVWGNFGVGNPMLLSNGQYDARFDDVLTLLSKQRELHSLGIHCYIPADLDGRLGGMIARCAAMSPPIRPPYTYITEFNYDSAFQGDPLNGHLSRGYTGEQFANREIEVLRNVYQPFIADGTLEGFATFIWAALDLRWLKGYNVDSDKGWQDTMLTAKDTGKLTIEKRSSIPLPPPKPAVIVPAGKGIAKPLAIAGKSAWNLRTDADIHAPEVGLVKAGETITLYPSSITPNGGNNYYYVERANPPTGESANGWLAYVLPVTAPLPSAPALPSAYMRLYQAQLKVAQITHDLSQAQLELAQLYRELDSETTGKAAA